jgi:gluconolactonase
MKEPF